MITTRYRRHFVVDKPALGGVYEKTEGDIRSLRKS